MKDAALLLFLSEYKDSSEEKEYIYEDGSRYTAAQTSDAPTRCLFRLAEKDGAGIRKVLCITSDLVRTKEVEGKKTRLDLYDDLIYELGGGEVSLISIPYDYREGIEEELTDAQIKDIKTNLPVRIYTEIARNLAAEDVEYVYVDYTGGMRDVSFLMTMVIRYLEFGGVECRQIVYSNWKDGEIVSIKYIYDMYQLINGVNEFVTTGNVTSLESFFDAKRQTKMKKLVKSIIDFANIMSLCDIGGIDSAREDLRKKLQEFEKAEKREHHGDAREYEKIYEKMMQTLVPMIRDRMFLNDDSGMSYVNMIRWCTHNRMIQQAVTLYVEKIPKLYCEQGLLEGIANCGASKSSFGKSKEMDAFYTDFYDKVSDGSLSEGFRELNCSWLKLLESCRKKWEEIDQTDIQKKEKRFIEYLRCYPAEGKFRDVKERFISIVKRKYVDDFSCQIYGEEVTQKSIATFLNFVQSYEKYSHYMLHDNKQEWDARKKMGTYEKKMNAVRKLYREPKVIEWLTAEKQKQLGEAMAYFLALKLLRNRMNHASENENKGGSQSKDEQRAISGLNSEIGIPIKEKMNFDDIRNLLTKALEVSEQLINSAEEFINLAKGAALER